MTAARFLVCIAILAAVTASLCVAQADDPNVSKLLALENVWVRAGANRDLNALDDILDKDFTYVDPTGQIHTKAEVLAGVRAAHASKLAIDVTIVHLHGHTAIVTGTFRSSRIERGKPIVESGRFVDTWCYRDKRWVAVASVATPFEN